MRNPKSPLLPFALRLSLAVALSLATPAAAQNLLNNPGFEGGFSNWRVLGNAFVEATSAPRFLPRTGTRLVSMFGQFAAGGSSSSVDQTLSCQAGELFTLSGFGRHFSGDALTGPGLPTGNALVLRLSFLDLGGNVLQSAEQVLVDGQSPTNSWRRGEVSATAPIGAVQVRAAAVFVQPAFAGGAGHIDDLELLRSLSQAPQRPLASRIGQGGRLEIREVRADGTQAPFSPFIMRGIAMGWTPPGFFPWTTTPPLANPDLVRVLDDLGEAGFNTLRFYYVPRSTNAADARATIGLLDYCWKAGFKVLFTFDASRFAAPTAVAELADSVQLLRNHPAVLAIALGNEWNLNQSRASTLGRAGEVQTLALALKSLDPDRVVISSLAISPDNDLFAADGSGVPLTTAIRQVAPAVDFYGINLYRVGSYHPFFYQWERTTNATPAAIFENGTDSWDWPNARIDYGPQTLEMRRHLEEASRVALGPNGRRWFAGQVTFAAVDEWWKNPNSNNSPQVQEPDGFFTTITLRPPSRQDLALVIQAEPDGHRSEEHLGILSLPNLTRKPVFDAIRDHQRFRQSALTTKTLGLTSVGYLGGSGGLDQGYVALSYEGNTVWFTTGGAEGRGLHLFQFDLASGDVLSHQRFDVFGALSGGGTALNDAIAAINALPNGALAAIGIADALAPSGTSTATLSPLLSRIQQRFGALRLSSGLPFRAGYALIGRVGASLPLAEGTPTVGNPVAVSAAIALDLDRDGIPDVVDQDDDGDGLTDADELSRGTDPLMPFSTPIVLKLERDLAGHLILDLELGDDPAGLLGLDLASARFELLTPSPVDLSSLLLSPVFQISLAPGGGLRLRTTAPLPAAPGFRLGLRALDSLGRLQSRTLAL